MHVLRSASRSHRSRSVDTHIVVSTLEETYVFRIDNAEEVTRVDPATDGLLASAPTLALRNVPRRTTTNGKSAYVDSSLVVQVTPQKVRLVEYNAALGLFSLVSEGWDAQKEGRSIVAADINASQIVLGLERGRLALFNMSESRQFQLLKYVTWDHPCCYGLTPCAGIETLPTLHTAPSRSQPSHAHPSIQQRITRAQSLYPSGAQTVSPCSP